MSGGTNPGGSSSWPWKILLFPFLSARGTRPCPGARRALADSRPGCRAIQPEAYDPKLDVDFTQLRDQDPAASGFGTAA
ncbi:hypothetical protein AB0I22_35690 [Streptomyces sp. NPDC050610]|uniref:hypothetical protein n=1 Tax=Streptomyces sp. NPDC050610 TaxID=3157097 RepID=UPI0034390D53